MGGNDVFGKQKSEDGRFLGHGADRDLELSRSLAEVMPEINLIDLIKFLHVCRTI